MVLRVNQRTSRMVLANNPDDGESCSPGCSNCLLHLRVRAQTGDLTSVMPGRASDVLNVTGGFAVGLPCPASNIVITIMIATS